MAKFTDYTQKTKPADADLLLIHDNAGAANKKTPFSGVWSWILDKLASAVISQLQTTNKSIIPAINELNSNLTRGFFKNINTIASIPDGEDLCQYLYDNYTEKSSIRIVGISSRTTVSMGAPVAGGGFLFFYRPQTDGYGLVVCFSYVQTIHIKRLNDDGWSKWQTIS